MSCGSISLRVADMLRQAVVPGLSFKHLLYPESDCRSLAFKSADLRLGNSIMLRWSTVALMAVASTGWSAADSPPSAASPENALQPGHSYHGEAFDEGPRRAAYL